MCGIYFSIGYGVDASEPNDTLRERLRCRGPDAHEVRSNKLKIPGHPWISTRLEGIVLSLRGDNICQQPLKGEDVISREHEASPAEFFMCWNGEAWTIDGNPVTGNDTQAVFNLMQQVLYMVSRRKRAKHSEYHILDVLARVRGPYAFVFLDEHNSKVYFARDCLGRRSLLFKCDAQSFVLSSVSDAHPGWTEVESNRLYVLDYNPQMSSLDRQQRIAHQQDILVDAASSSGLMFPIHALPIEWSRGLFEINHDTPPAEIPLLTQDTVSVSALDEHLRRSLDLRLNLPTHVPCYSEQQESSRVAILFSGGLDCCALARLAHDILPFDEPVDLLNVAFHNPRIHGDVLAEGDNSAFEACPDRITARASLTELTIMCPERQWRFVEINVPFEESTKHREIVTSLLAPHDTEMDLSIGLALYFAARGRGLVQGEQYRTQASVLLSGLGADELFGGYQRHATAFSRGGFEALVTELALDTARLGKRNLGRDDRIIAHWGREARYPYLDEALVEWSAKTPVWEKCGFRNEVSPSSAGAPENDIESGKLVLRLLASRLGLTGVAREKKRAIQFGARTAKMQRGKTKGTDAIS
ncbi:MAG: hypothetical protein Q9159_004322 [Coniocarpon cinnabarinum]